MIGVIQTNEMTKMLKSDYYIEPTELDLLIFEKLVPPDHYLRQVKAILDFEFVRSAVQDCYSESMGRHAIDPVLVFKLEFLMHHYSLSDREVIGEAQVNVAYRYFLDLSVNSPLPVPSLLSQFRTRLGEKYQELFDGIVAQARQHGLVKDRLRLKDATHVIANIAIPSTIQLVAQVRSKLLTSLEPYAPEQVQLAQQEVEHIRQVTADLKDEARLLHRVEHLRQIVVAADEVQAQLGPTSSPDPQRVRFEEALATAHKLLVDQDDPDGSDRLRSAVDPEARRGKHGRYYDGYSCDISQDPDSELLTAVNVLPANGDEAADACTLLESEQAAHHNQVAALSIDSVGFQGALLRELSRPEGLNLTVYVPPHSQGIADTPYFKPADFQLSPDGTSLMCPNEVETDRRHRNDKDTAWVFHFKRSDCAACPLWEQCMAKVPAKHGRYVTKNDYQAEYDAARQLAQTETYALVRQQHPKVERKLAEMVRYHGGRRARYRGRRRVKIQFLLIGIVVNIKRMVRLLAERLYLPDDQPAV
jgi:transposase